MEICPSCQATIPTGERVCLECGYTISGDAGDDPWLNRLIAGRYRIQRKLGDGGMGEVYLAHQQQMDRHVALKLLNDDLAENPSQVERFRREAQAASQLKHPNTIVVHDFGQDDDGTLFIAMEYLDGYSLADLLDAEDAIQPERLVSILSQVCDSLAEAHNRDLVHRDLKPENIFLTQRNGVADTAKVLDFGIAKLNRSSSGEVVERLTRAGTICGTPHYMAPEQIRDEPVDGRADVYALGVLIYRAVAGHEPFDAPKMVDLLTAHLKDAPPPIEHGPAKPDPAWAKLETVARRALEKDPTHRPQDVQELKALLRGCVFTPTSEDPSILPVTPTLQAIPRQWSRVYGLGVVGILLSVIIFSYLSEQASEPRPVEPKTETAQVSAVMETDSGIKDTGLEPQKTLPGEFNAENYLLLLSKVSALQKEVEQLNAERDRERAVIDDGEPSKATAIEHVKKASTPAELPPSQMAHPKSP